MTLLLSTFCWTGSGLTEGLDAGGGVKCERFKESVSLALGGGGRMIFLKLTTKRRSSKRCNNKDNNTPLSVLITRSLVPLVYNPVIIHNED